MATLPVFFSMGGRPVKTRGRASAVLRAIDWPALPMLSKIPRWLRPQLCYHEHPSVCGGGRSRTPYWFGSSHPYQTLRSTYKVGVCVAFPDDPVKGPGSRCVGATRCRVAPAGRNPTYQELFFFGELKCDMRTGSARTHHRLRWCRYPPRFAALSNVQRETQPRGSFRRRLE